MDKTPVANPEMVAEIDRLRKERHAIILAHNYQRAEMQQIADFVGDSLELSIKAAHLPDVEVVVFCSVDFMAETAKLLSPDKLVLLPDPQAGCPMADMVTPDALRALKAQHPGAPVVCYVNTSAAVKAECDIACTSANALQIVNSLSADEVLFVPDGNLGSWVQRFTEKRLILWPGYCPTHHCVLPEAIERAKAAHPGAEVMVHPECPPAVADMADHVVSTGQMLRVARASAASAFIVVTEEGMLHRLRTENPGKAFFHLEPILVCPNMKRTRLEKVLWSLQDLQYPMEIPADIAQRARLVIERMLEVSR